MRNSLYSVSLEDALSVVGSKGKYQKHLLIVTCGIWLSQALFMMNLPYLLSHPDSECADDNCCEDYKKNPEIKISNPAFEWELICSQKYKSSLISLLYFTGLGFGTCSLSYLANRFGRKSIIIICLIVTSITNLLASASPNAEFFMVCSLLSGIFIGGCTITSFVFVQECVDGEIRNIYTGFIFSSWGIGMCLMSLLNWAISEWRIHMILIGCSNFIWVPFVLRFYESPRFLASNQGKYALARVILNNIARYNGSSEFTEMLEGEKLIGYQESGTSQSLPSPTHGVKYSFVPISNGIVSVSESEVVDIKKYSFLDLTKLDSIRRPLFITSYLWLIISLGYYAVVFSIPHYVGSPYLNGFLMALAETISCFIVALLLNKLGRQLSFVINFGVAGVCCLLALAFISKSYPNLTIMKINKTIQIILISVARFAIVTLRLTGYIYTVEVFPTSVRSLVFGVLGLVSVIGGAAAPIIIVLGEVAKIHGLFFVGLLLVSASFASCLLPETLGKSMEDYVDEEKECMASPKNQVQSIEMGNSGKKNFKKLKEESVE